MGALLALGVLCVSAIAAHAQYLDGELCERTGVEPDAVARFFEDVAFEDDTPDDGEDSRRLIKWTSPIRVEFWVPHKIDRVYEDDLNMLFPVFNLGLDNPNVDLDAHFQGIEEGVKRKANLFIAVAKDFDSYRFMADRFETMKNCFNCQTLSRRIKEALENDPRRLGDGKGCFSTTYGDVAGKIHQSITVMPSYGEYRASCHARGMMQSLGLTRLGTGQPASALSGDLKPGPYKSDFDLLLLRIMYDRRIKPGMERHKARQLIRKIVRDACPNADYNPFFVPKD